MNQTRAADTDIVLVGAGIMSATLAVFLKELEPSLRIEIFETLEGAALESSDAWNNAGTGHAALCELNYTPQRSDGSIVADNIIEDTDARAGGSGQNGNAVNVYRAADVTVRGNTIRRAAFSAVRGNGASNFQVIGNNCAGFGETAKGIDRR